MTGLWEKMAASDLNWWPHACAARAAAPRAEFCNFWGSFYRGQYLGVIPEEHALPANCSYRLFGRMRHAQNSVAFFLR